MLVIWSWKTAIWVRVPLIFAGTSIIWPVSWPTGVFWIVITSLVSVTWSLVVPAVKAELEARNGFFVHGSVCTNWFAVECVLVLKLRIIFRRNVSSNVGGKGGICPLLLNHRLQLSCEVINRYSTINQHGWRSSRNYSNIFTRCLPPVVRVDWFQRLTVLLGWIF